MLVEKKEKIALSHLPQSPGVYRFYDKNDILIYVGKAKNLKNRVSSYFNQLQSHNQKTKRLVSQITKLEFTVVNTEFDALLLENNLIKTHQPKYNILLKDDKSYPYVCITNESFPRLLVTRQPEKQEGKYYGPFTNLKAMNTVLELIKELYHFRTCIFHLSEENIQKKKFKICLEYHLGNCLGPCEGLQDESDYLQEVQQVQHILRGNIYQVKQYFTTLMQQHAEVLEFEKAQECKQKLNLLDNFQSKSLVVNPKSSDMDVLSILSDETVAYLHFFRIKEGAIIFTKNIDIKKKLDENDDDILSYVALNLREESKSEALEIITNIPLGIELNGVKNILPKIGDKKKLLELSLKNVLLYKKEKQRVALEKSLKEDATASVKELKQVLQLPHTPRHIECFDNSNIQGTTPVASMVYFKNGRPYKKEYRHFNIKTVVGANDFASMEEIVFRRYKRLKEEEKDFPDLVVIDGGKGQLSSACKALKDLDLYGKIPIVGIAKKLEEIYFPEDEIPLHIHKKSPALRLLQQVRNEAHRFAIEFHRKKRDKKTIHSQLEDIEGIGQSTITKLLQEFKTISKIKDASREEISKVVGKSKADIIKERLK